MTPHSPLTATQFNQVINLVEARGSERPTGGTGRCFAGRHRGIIGCFVTRASDNLIALRGNAVYDVTRHRRRIAKRVNVYGTQFASLAAELTGREHAIEARARL